MPLRNFGSILSFAAELESLDQAFYTFSAKNPVWARYKDIFEEFARDARKREQVVLRTRRENVTEMILEEIKDFRRDPFVTDREGADSLGVGGILEKAREIEENATRFYLEAAEKLKSLSEVSRMLKLMGKKRKTNRDKLDAL